MAGTSEGLGRRIAEFRERKDIRQRDLAERAGLSPTFLSEVENGKRNIGSDALLRIANALGASLDFLLRGDEPERRTRDPLVIPSGLSDAAERQGWSYGQTVGLLQTKRMVVAKRSPGGMAERTVEDMTAEEWIHFFERVFTEA